MGTHTTRRAIANRIGTGGKSLLASSALLTTLIAVPQAAQAVTVDAASSITYEIANSTTCRIRSTNRVEATQVDRIDNAAGFDYDTYQTEILDASGRRLTSTITEFGSPAGNRGIATLDHVLNLSTSVSYANTQHNFVFTEIIGTNTAGPVRRTEALSTSGLVAAGGACETIGNDILGASNGNDPVANAGPDQNLTYVAGRTVQLTARGSSTRFASGINLQWTQIAGTPVTLNNPTGLQPTFTMPAGLTADETLAFEVRVTSRGSGDINFDTVNINLDVNEAPTANAGPDQAPAPLTAGTIVSVTLDGTGSSDPEGDTLSYRWRQTAGSLPLGLQNPTTARPSFSFPQQNVGDTYTYELIVNDGMTDSVADTVDIVFQDAIANAAPTANAGPDIVDVNYVNNAPVQLDASGSTDPEGDPLTYSWTQIGGLNVTLQDANTATPNFNIDFGSATATFGFTFEVTVSDGTSSNTDRVGVSLTPQGTLQATTPTQFAFQNTTSACNVFASTDVTGAMDDDGSNNDLFLTSLVTAPA